jgi:hypothetical protein
VGLDSDVGIEVFEALLRGDEFGSADVFLAIEDLSLEVRRIDDIEVDESDPADPGSGEIECRRTAEPPRTDDEDGTVLETVLAPDADIREDQVTRISKEFVLGERGLAGKVRRGAVRARVRELSGSRQFVSSWDRRVDEVR